MALVRARPVGVRPVRELFRDPRFRLVFAGEVSSAAGDSVMLIVLMIWVKELTGSSGLAGAVMLAMAAPALASPLLGWGADRVRRRPFLVWVNLTSAAALVPLLAVHDRRHIWIIYAVAVAYGVSFSLNGAGMAGLLKELVADGRLADANGGLRTVREGLRLVGPLAGAGLYATTGAGTVVLIDIASFLVAAVCFLLLRVAEPAAARTGLHWATEAAAGFRHVFAEPVLRRTALALGAAFLVFETVEAGVFAYVDSGLHRPATYVGVLMTVMGVGSIAGGVLAPRLIRRAGEATGVAAGLAGLALGVGPLVYARVWLGLVAVPFAGFGTSLALVAFATAMQRRTPGPLLGRVSTASDLLIGVPQTVSIAAGAVLVSVVDYRWMFGTVAVALVVIATALLAAGRRGLPAPRPPAVAVAPPAVAPPDVVAARPS